MLNLDILCKPKEMNKALLGKLAWSGLTKDGEFWCDVLSAKYERWGGGRLGFIDKQRDSRIWKGIVWGAELLRLGS